MVIFDQLRISDDGRMFYLDVHVNKADYFDDIYLDKILIATSGQVSETDPLSPGNSYVYCLEIPGSEKEIHLALQPVDFNEYFTGSDFSSELFFVYVICKGTVGECTPCRLDELTTLGVTFDYGKLYQQVMGFTKQLADDCNIPDGFIDLMLTFGAFKASVETEHYVPAIKFYKQLFEGGHGMTPYSATSKPCGCHG